MESLFGQKGIKGERRDELLSAYLDDQLSAEESARLEAQLAVDPALQVELRALRHTVALVRDLPSVPLPRNFILSQAMAARPQPARRGARRAPLRRAWAAPFLTAATAVFSLLFAVVLAGDLLFLGVGGMAPAPAAEQFIVIEEAEAPREAPASAPEGEKIVVEKAVEVEVEAEVVVAEDELAASTAPAELAEAPPPIAPEVTVMTEAEATAKEAEEPEEDTTAETREAGDATAAATGGGGPTPEPAVPSPLSQLSPTAAKVAESRSIAATEEAEATTAPAAGAGLGGMDLDPSPSPNEAGEATPWATGEQEDEEKVAGSEEIPLGPEARPAR